MRASWIRIAGALLAASAPAQTLYEKDGISLEGTVRMVARNAAVCQVQEENEGPESYEQMKANHGRPLHVWRVDYSAFNGSGKSLSDLTAHFQIEAEWPPCTNWTGLGPYPGPVQWAGSFETLQRTAGLRPGEEAAATAYVLAIDGEQPRFGRRQVMYRFVEATAEAPVEPAPVTARTDPEPAREPGGPPSPLCKERLQPPCWIELANQSGCYLYIDLYTDDLSATWDGGCVDGRANGIGTVGFTVGDASREDSGELAKGKRTGSWTVYSPNGRMGSGPYVDGVAQGIWTTRGPAGDVATGPYVDGERHGVWSQREADGTSFKSEYVRGELQPLEEVP